MSARTSLFELDGRVAVVTGAGGWLGPAMCEGLAAAGAAVAVVGRTPAGLEAVCDRIRDAGGTAVPVPCDVADQGSVSAMAEAVVAELGGIDILVNGAAIYPVRPWTEIDPSEWDAVIATNLKGAFLCARAVFPSMRARGKGRVINITSTTFHYGFPADGTVMDYITSKGGLIGFTRALAREVGPDGITVNALSAGAFEPPAATTPPYNAWVLERQALKRRGIPADVANVVVFLAGDASAFVTGQTIVVDGGMAML